ncbi:FliM/FliN family flagellar motor switch protein [Massilia forsythiae]|uniref:FliM/FliN family flagellar motor switch protein n=1 Tax=Massilia forsythiae TaxID=2728020 RepID=A0A7Z2VUI9_9BURK|nr:FliM/FliN family flagellar motor C-terminal domain-containing protein [Massilia forsythiae]QJD99480.1 FliM/FliN family flagellar motor switch protein [Massilia forsythiae]
MTHVLSLIGSGRLALLERAVAAALQPWRDAWGIPVDAVGVAVRRAGQVEPAAAAAQRAAAAAAWRGALRDCLFPDGGAGLYASPPLLAPRLAGQADEALGALMAQLAQAAGNAAAPAAVEIDLGIGAGARRFALPRTAVDALAPKPAAQGTALEAVDLGGVTAAAEVILEVDAGATEVPLGALAALRPGDVLRLDSRLDQALTVRVRGGAAIALGYLGRSGDYAAVEIVKSSTGAATS